MATTTAMQMATAMMAKQAEAAMTVTEEKELRTFSGKSRFQIGSVIPKRHPKTVSHPKTGQPSQFGLSMGIAIVRDFHSQLKIHTVFLLS